MTPANILVDLGFWLSLAALLVAAAAIVFVFLLSRSHRRHRKDLRAVRRKISTLEASYREDKEQRYDPLWDFGQALKQQLPQLRDAVNRLQSEVGGLRQLKPGRDGDTASPFPVTDANPRAADRNELTVEDAQRWFEAWCVTSRRPPLPEDVRPIALRCVDVIAAKTPLETPVPIYEEMESGEILCFVQEGRKQGFAFPHPDAFYSAAVQHFDHTIRQADYRGDRTSWIGRFHAVSLIRTADGRWQPASRVIA